MIHLHSSKCQAPCGASHITSHTSARYADGIELLNVGAMDKLNQPLSNIAPLSRLGLDRYVTPEDFLPQTVLGSGGAIEYARAATAASLDAVRFHGPPIRVCYGPDPANVLDIFAEEGQKDLPVLVFFHGGAWTAGYLWWSGFMAPAIQRLPAILVAPTYRLAPGSRFPAPLADVERALEWVRANIGQFGGDPNRLVIGGHSAGAHLASLCALSRPEAMSGVLACLPLSASFDLRYPNPAPGSGEERVYKYLLNHSQDDTAASPICFAQNAAIPFHIIIGELDFDRVKRTSMEFYDLMTSMQKLCTLTSLEGYNHFDVHLALRDPLHTWYKKIERIMYDA
ncbi:putative Arylformamidase [Hyphomicrobiales bacterium]|nr:putative Arylformamidase [Hyphomicrobiales bacterium]CAH1671611.1 Acetyl esterase/lipase [Hyphomicrobiales bacterium]